MSHAYLAPSSAGVWGHCTAWAVFNEANPDGLQCDTDASELGTLAHSLLADNLEGKPRQDDPRVDEEMVACTEWAADSIRELAAGAQISIEQTLPATDYFGPDVWGTPDARWYDGVGGMHIADFKYGHEYVPVVANDQLSVYAALTLTQSAKLSDHKGPVHFHILQPRCFMDQPLRTWTTDAAWLSKSTAPLVEQAATAREMPMEKTGEHCKHCPGRLACKSFLQMAAHAVEVSAIHKEPVIKSDTQLAIWLTQLRQAERNISSMLKAVEEVVDAKLSAGQNVPFFELSKPKRIGADWDDEMNEADIISMLEPFAQVTKQKLMTPGQAAKAGVPKEMIDALSKPKYSARKVVATDLKTIQSLFTR